MSGIIFIAFVTTFFFAAAYPYRLWTKYEDGHGHYIIPYEFDKAYDSRFRGRILEGMREIGNNTCIRFQERTRKFEHEYLWIYQGTTRNCLTWHVGRPVRRTTPTRNAVKLDYRSWNYCLTRHIILHELLHVIGLDHEQQFINEGNYMKKHKITKEHLKKHPIDFYVNAHFKWVCKTYKCKKCPAMKN